MRHANHHEWVYSSFESEMPSTGNAIFPLRGAVKVITPQQCSKARRQTAAVFAPFADWLDTHGWEFQLGVV
jgi:hypothetical protein